MEKDRRHNHNEAITHLALPEHGIPVLLRASQEKWDGAVPGRLVRVVPLAALGNFVHPHTRPVFEKEYGSVSKLTRANVLLLLGMANALSQSGQEGWVRDAEAAIRRWAASLGKKLARTTETLLRQKPERVSLELVTILSEELNERLSKPRFVVWWAQRERRFASGLLCKDAGTALYAMALSHLGQPGALGACLRCGNPFFHLRKGQKYCNYKCQAAAGMARKRAADKERAAKRKAKKSPKRNRRR